MSKTPLQLTKDKFGEKTKLVDAVKAFTTSDLWLGRTNDGKGLERVSNAKLLRLHTIFSAVKEKFGTRDGLINAIADIEKRTKDDGFKKRLGAYPVPRLFDMHQSAEKRAKHAAKIAKDAPAKPEKAAKAAPAKAATPAKKAAPKEAAVEAPKEKKATKAAKAKS